MKLEGVRKSRDGSDTTVFLFAMNAKEAEMVAKLAAKVRHILPSLHDMQGARHRLKNIYQVIGKALVVEGFKSHKDLKNLSFE